VDAVVAVAGIEPFGLPRGIGDDDVAYLELSVWNEVIGANLTGMFLTLKHAVRAMRRTGGGAIVVTGSPTGLFGFATDQVACSTSKAGCHGLARVVAAGAIQDDIRVNLVIPGLVDTPLVSRFMEDTERAAAFCETVPMRRAGRAGEVARLNLWLCSEEASYGCGGTFMVDGGQMVV
jgi:NAD(P)-dependent dehydrogenase (short-subunit alcohol dehydrogenase family)